MLTRLVRTPTRLNSFRLFNGLASDTVISKHDNHQLIRREVNKAIDRNLGEWLKQKRELELEALQGVLKLNINDSWEHIDRVTSGLSRQKKPKKCKTKLSQNESDYINRFIDILRKNHGIRELKVDDSRDVVAVITCPEQAVRDQLADNGTCLHETLLYVAHCMLPDLPCFRMEELFEVVFFKENLNITDSEGNNALHRLLMQEGEVNLPVLQFLIDQGVSVKMKNAAGKTALDYIAECDLLDKTNISLDDRIEEFLL